MNDAIKRLKTWVAKEIANDLRSRAQPWWLTVYGLGLIVMSVVFAGIWPKQFLEPQVWNLAANVTGALPYASQAAGTAGGGGTAVVLLADYSGLGVSTVFSTAPYWSAATEVA